MFKYGQQRKKKNEKIVNPKKRADKLNEAAQHKIDKVESKDLGKYAQQQLLKKSRKALKTK